MDVRDCRREMDSGIDPSSRLETKMLRKAASGSRMGQRDRDGERVHSRFKVVMLQIAIGTVPVNWLLPKYLIPNENTMFQHGQAGNGQQPESRQRGIGLWNRAGQLVSVDIPGTHARSSQE